MDIVLRKKWFGGILGDAHNYNVRTLALSEFSCNRSVVFVSSATLLLLLTQILVCCIDRLNPQAEAVILNK